MKKFIGIIIRKVQRHALPVEKKMIVNQRFRFESIVMKELGETIPPTWGTFIGAIGILPSGSAATFLRSLGAQPLSSGFAS